MSPKARAQVIGRMAERITIQRNAATQGGMGQPLATWADYMADVWAQEQQMTGAEVMRAGFTISDDPILWTVRWREDLTPTVKDRVVRRGSTYYDIRSIREVGGRRRFWEITAVRHV